MGVYIKGFPLPNNCGACPLRLAWCRERIYMVTRPERCPLVPVPPHGRLIDADALMNEFEKAQRTMQQHGQEYSCSFLSSSQELSTEWYCVEDMLENAPTVLEAEEGE